MAAATISKRRFDAVLRIVVEYDKLSRFKFIASKSVVLIYGESKNSHLLNSRNGVFKLGPDKVPEKTSYDHV